MKEFDICIVGGGPAGIAVACKLNQLGFDVLLITREAPAGQPGMAQSLSPGVFTLLGTVGLELDALRAYVTQLDHSIKQWTDESLHTDHPQGWLANRGGFDGALLNAARRLGIKILERAKVISLEHTESGWVLRLLHEGKYSTLRSTFLVDASGKKSLLRGTKKRVATCTFAMGGCWKNNPFPQRTTVLESAKSCWLWGAAMPDGNFYATVFTDPQEIQGSSSIQQHYVSAIGASKLFKDCLQGSLVGRLSAFDVTPYYYEAPAGPDYIKVGEASAGLDPISSQGVQSAVANAIQGAIVVNTIFSAPGDLSIALDFYKERQQEMMGHHLELSTESYSSATPWQGQTFWKNRIRSHSAAHDRMQPDPQHWTPCQPVQFSGRASLVPTPCILGNQITRRPALVHPGLERPLVFWDNREISTIIGGLSGRFEGAELIRRWSCSLQPGRAVQLFYRLKQAGVLESANN